MAPVDQPNEVAPAVPSSAQVIVDRLAAGSLPGQRDDQYRLALAVEGGGMRGVISAGMLLALEQLGMTACIDMVVGTSAGAISGAFFTHGCTVEGSVLFYSDLNSEPFLNRNRLLKRESALDLDYLIDIAAVARGLDFSAIADAPIALYATVTPTDPANEIRHFRVDGTPQRVASILKATASLPVLAGSAKVVEGLEYVDGGLREQIPWHTAASLGATHILVLPSRPVRAGQDLETLSFIERVSVIPVVRRVHGDHIAQLVSDLPERSSREAWNLRAIADGKALPIQRSADGTRPRFDIVDLDTDVHLPGRLERSRPVLVDALIEGAEAVVGHFGLADGNAVVVEQRVVLTHPSAPVKHFRASQLADLVVERRA